MLAAALEHRHETAIPLAPAAGDASLSRNQVHRIGKQVALKATVLSDHVKHDFAAGNGDQQSGDEAGRAALETKVLYFRDNNLARTTNLISEV